MENFERSLTEYNEGQKENSASHNTYYAGKTGTGKGQLSGWAKEHGIASGNLKIFEAHASQPAHLEELFQFLFPNGFLLNYDSLEILDSVLEQFDRGAYESGDVEKQEVEELYQLLEDGHPERRVDKLEELLRENPARSLKLRLQEVREKQEEIRQRIRQLREYGYKNNDLPDTFQKSYADGLNRRFDIEVLVPISDSMPTCDVPDFFTPFAIPINDYAEQEQLEDGLKIIFGNQYQDYSRIYNKVVDDSTSFEDVKNVESLGGKKYIQQGSFADGESFQVTETNIEDQQLKSFQRRFDKLFSTRGIVCSPDFEHRLRPKLKDAILGDEPDIVILYTGFLNNEALRKFVITYFMETYEDIIQKLKPREVSKLDRKFIVSGIEAQEWVKENSRESKFYVHDKVPVTQLDRMMDNCRHFNTDFWFDVKPDKVHDIILSKASDRFATSMNEGDVDEFSWSNELKKEYRKAINHIPYNSLDGKYPELGYGFVYLEGTRSIPDWTLRGRKQYGHRMPTPRMCVQDPVDRFSMEDDWSFFLQFDRWDSISFQDYQRQLFKQDWESNAEPYLEEEKKKEQQKEQEEQEREEEMKQLRKNTAISKLEAKVEKRGEVPGEWKEMVQEIHSEMVADDVIPEDFSDRKIYEYTQERREELKEEFETRRPDDITYKQIAKELVQDKEFVFGGNSKSDKQFRAEEYILEEYPEFGESAAEEVGRKAADKAVSWLQTEGLLNDSLHAEIKRSEFEQRISEAFKFAEFESVEGKSSGRDEGSSLESDTQDTVQEGDVDEDSPEGQSDSAYREVKITDSIPEFTGNDLEDYGPFDEGDVARIPSENAEILMNRGQAVPAEDG